MADLNCPQCETLLRNVEASADGYVGCLNCGKRFLVQAVAPASGDPAGQAGPLKPEVPLQIRSEEDSIREPAAGGYGLLHLLGYLILFVFGLAGIWLGVLCQRVYDKTSLDETLLLLIFALFLPVVGIICLCLVRIPADIDRHAVRLVWRLGALTEAPSAPPGSALPYILPLTVAGPLLVMVPILMFGDDGIFRGPIFILAPLGAVTTFLGLSMGEFQRFFWRMECLSLALIKMKETGRRMAPPAYLAPYWMLCAAILFATGFLCMCLDCNQKELGLWVTIGLGLAGGAYSLFRLTDQAIRSISAWEYSAIPMKKNVPVHTGGWPGISLPEDVQVVSSLAFLLALGMGLIMVVSVLFGKVSIKELGPFLIGFGGIAVVFWLGNFLILAFRATQAVEYVTQFHRKKFLPRSKKPADPIRHFIHGSRILICTLFGASLLILGLWVLVFAVPCLLVLWLATLSLLGRRASAALAEAGQNASKEVEAA